METKTSEITIKAAGEGKATVVIATLGIKDKDGDVLLPGAFGEQVVPVVGAHDWKMPPIGKARVFEQADEAVAEIEFNDTTEGQNWYRALKFDWEHPPARQQYSWGFQVPQTHTHRGKHQNEEVRFLHGSTTGEPLPIFEVSPVLVGAGQNTRSVSVKAFDDLPDPEEDPRPFDDLKQAGVRIQSLIFPKSKWESADAVRSWLRSHDFSTSLDTTENSYRARQEDPGRFQRLRSFCINPSRDASSENCRVMAVGGPMKESRSMTVDSSTAMVTESKRIIGAHTTPTDERPWNFAIEHRQVKAAMPGGFYRNLFAVQDPGRESLRANYRYLHHRVEGDGNPGTASIVACSQILHALHKGLIPPDERQGVYAHMVQHLREAGLEPPELREIDSYVYPYDEEAKLFLWQADDILLQTGNIHNWRTKKGMTLSQERIDQFERMDQKWAALRLLLSAKGLDRPYDELLERMTVEARGEAIADRMEKLTAKTQHEVETANRDMTHSFVARLVPKLT